MSPVNQIQEILRRSANESTLTYPDYKYVFLIGVMEGAACALGHFPHVQERWQHIDLIKALSDYDNNASTGNNDEG